MRDQLSVRKEHRKAYKNEVNHYSDKEHAHRKKPSRILTSFALKGLIRVSALLVLTKNERYN